MEEETNIQNREEVKEQLRSEEAAENGKNILPKICVWFSNAPKQQERKNSGSQLSMGKNFHVLGQVVFKIGIIQISILCFFSSENQIVEKDFMIGQACFWIFAFFGLFFTEGLILIIWP